MDLIEPMTEDEYAALMADEKYAALYRKFCTEAIEDGWSEDYAQGFSLTMTKLIHDGKLVEGPDDTYRFADQKH